MPVSTPVTSPLTEARAAIKAIMEAEFAAEAFPVRDDHIHESLGHEGTVIGISPIRSILFPGDANTRQHEVKVQFYGRWKKEIDAETRVDPVTVETYAERFLRAIQSTDVVGSQRVWYFMVTELTFPHDPTGNKTRFEATVVSYGDNSSILETTG